MENYQVRFRAKRFLLGIIKKAGKCTQNDTQVLTVYHIYIIIIVALCFNLASLIKQESASIFKSKIKMAFKDYNQALNGESE